VATPSVTGVGKDKFQVGFNRGKETRGNASNASERGCFYRTNHGIDVLIGIINFESIGSEQNRRTKAA